MKKTILLLLTALTLTTTFTSCDKDSVKAFIIEGTWSGYLQACYQDRWGETSTTFRTAMYFKQETMYSGYGYELDYDSSNRFSRYYFSEFRWTINDEIIYINYLDSRFGRTRIYDYKLNLASFRGYMDDGTNRDIFFDLSPTSNFDWSPYINSYR